MLNLPKSVFDLEVNGQIYKVCFVLTILCHNNGFQLQASNNISRVKSSFATNMTLSVKGDSGTDRQHWFQAASI